MAAAVAAAVIFSGQPRALSEENNGTAELKPWRHDAPGFALPTVNGPQLRLDAHRGRVVLVHFFATWCEPCRDELPALRRLVARAKPDSIAVLAVSVGEVELRVRRFLDSVPVNFPVLLDRDRALAKAWAVSALPTTIILDADLEPRLAAEADFAWDRIEPGTLIEMLKAAKAAQTVTTIQPGG